MSWIESADFGKEDQVYGKMRAALGSQSSLFLL